MNWRSSVLSLSVRRSRSDWSRFSIAAAVIGLDCVQFGVVLEDKLVGQKLSVLEDFSMGVRQSEFKDMQGLEVQLPAPIACAFRPNWAQKIFVEV
jgi:hypothetical protein